MRITEQGLLVLDVPILYSLLRRTAFSAETVRQRRMREISVPIEPCEPCLRSTLDGSRALVHSARLYDASPARWGIDVFPLKL